MELNNMDENNFEQVQKAFYEMQEAHWNSLSKDAQLMVFCAVARRMNQAMIQGSSYRHTLYEVFGFGPEAYVPAQLAGYLDIHNGNMLPDQQIRQIEFVLDQLKQAGGVVPEGFRDLIVQKLFL